MDDLLVHLVILHIVNNTSPHFGDILHQSVEMYIIYIMYILFFKYKNKQKQKYYTKTKANADPVSNYFNFSDLMILKMCEKKPLKVPRRRI